MKKLNIFGKIITLLNPAEKGKKYASELKNKKRFTNDGEVKADSLTNSQAAYRIGYLQARKDNAKAFNSNKNKKEKKAQTKQNNK